MTGLRRWARIGRLVAIVALCVVAGGACSSHRYADRHATRLAVGEDVLTLTVDNANGDVAVRAGPQGHIQVVSTRRASQRADVEQIGLHIVGGGRGAKVRTDVPCGLNNYAVHFEIWVPPGTRVIVRTGAGDIHVRDTMARVTVVTGGGDVDVRAARGGVDVRTGGGDVEVRDAHAQIRVLTAGGSIEARDVAGEIDVETGSGAIRYDGQPQGACRLETGSGDIELRLPTDPDLRLELKARGGDIRVGWPVEGHVSWRRVRGTIGRGDAGEILANTGRGDITLRRR